MEKKILYPFSAIVGQKKMKEALILNIINPSLGGVLIRGEKGTAKSTLVRAIADLMEKRKENDCEFHCNPYDVTQMCNECKEKLRNNEDINIVDGVMKVVNLPVSATEDRVVGTLDIEYAIKTGEKKFEKGILGLANRNILYVDEINLLDDNIVDVLLDSAAMGINTIEREGISFSHPAKFILVGTMNPEEGDLRPQLLDRFGLVVDVVGEKNIEQRVEVIKRRLAFENNPVDFVKGYESEEKKLQKQIERAKELLKEVACDEELYKIIAKIGIELGVDGHRADISIIKTAMTIAAFENRKNVEKSDVVRAAILCLPHRMRKNPFDDSILEEDEIKRLIEEM